MKNVLSTVFSALAVTAVIALSATPAFAESTQKLNDDAELLSSSEQETIENNLKNCTLATGWDIIIYTNNNNVPSSDMEDYCNDYYDNHGYGCGDEKSGVMLTIDMSSREMYILTKGEAMYCFSDARTDDLLDDVQYELSSGDYKGACDEFTQTVELYYNVGSDTSNDASYKNVEIVLTAGEKAARGISYGCSFMIIGAIAGIIISLSINYKYSKLGREANYDLAKNSSLNLTEKRDQFLYKNVTSTTVSSSSSSSHSSSHRSSSHSSHHSSHSSHGGGGRHF